MYTRRLQLPAHSFFLFGPRGTGKTTWLRHVLPNALWFDLLSTKLFLELTRDPDLFRTTVEARLPGTWVVIDEVQRMPALLNEVHSLMSRHGRLYRFALSGSSARRLKRLDVNLLAGRAINRQFYPLTAAELNYDFDVELVLRAGLLPQVHAEPEFAIDALEAYVENYIREEIKVEAAVRNLDSFSRFLQLGALMNGQILNVASLARDAAVARPTVIGYFSILVDTLIGTRLPAWRRRAKVKEVKSPKFYLFDSGVARALAGRLREPMEGTERGFLMETWVIHELRAAMSILGTGGELFYWQTPSGTEVDFIWTRGNRAVGIEVKSAATWRRESGNSLRTLLEAKVIKSAFGVYTGSTELKDGEVRIFPIKQFLKELSRGNIYE